MTPLHALVARWRKQADRLSRTARLSNSLNVLSWDETTARALQGCADELERALQAERSEPVYQRIDDESATYQRVEPAEVAAALGAERPKPTPRYVVTEIQPLVDGFTLACNCSFLKVVACPNHPSRVANEALLGRAKTSGRQPRARRK